MEKLFIIVILLAALLGIVSGNGEAIGNSILDSGKTAVGLGITLAGAYCLWCGILKVMEVSGLSQKLSRLFRPIIRALMPGIQKSEEAMEAVSMNFAANLLGMGNAATPAGLRAVKFMQELAGNVTAPTNAMCMFLIINTSSLQLVPTTVISMRAAAGSAVPADILLPSLLASLCSTIFAVALTLIVQKIQKSRGKKA